MIVGGVVEVTEGVNKGITGKILCFHDGFVEIERKDGAVLCVKDGCYAPVDPTKHDNINHPAHYTNGKYECLDVMEDVFGREAVMNFCLLNTFKYVWRHSKKNGKEDLEKAAFYLNRAIGMYDGKDT